MKTTLVHRKCKKCVHLDEWDKLGCPHMGCMAGGFIHFKDAESCNIPTSAPCDESGFKDAVPTDERMIRVTKPMYGEIQKYAWYSTDGYDTSVNFTSLPEWEELELAPPKDFKPECYSDMVNKHSRDEEGHIIFVGRVPRCDSCDIRERCIYKRESEMQ